MVYFAKGAKSSSTTNLQQPDLRVRISRGAQVGQRHKQAAGEKPCLWKSLKRMVGPNGLEPSTSSVSRKRSNQLSYGPTCERLCF